MGTLTLPDLVGCIKECQVGEEVIWSSKPHFRAYFVRRPEIMRTDDFYAVLHILQDSVSHHNLMVTLFPSTRFIFQHERMRMVNKDDYTKMRLAFSGT